MVTASIVRAHEVYGLDYDSKKILFPKVPGNGHWDELIDNRMQILEADPERYMAFPVLVKFGSSYILHYSDSAAHGSGTVVKHKRWDGDYDAYGEMIWSEPVQFVISAGVYNTSLLDGLMATGDVATFRAYVVQKTSGGYSVTTQSVVSYGGENYALWSQPRLGPGGKWYRTGYRSPVTPTRTALFVSDDQVLPYAFHSMMADDAAKNFSEADFFKPTGTVWYAVIREGNSSTRPYYVISADDMATWSAPVQFAADGITDGRQPIFLTLASGAVVYACGDRSGTAGDSPAGDSINSENGTGIGVWYLAPGWYAVPGDLPNWGFEYRCARFYSTDGGQPALAEVDTDRLLVVYYGRRHIADNAIVTPAGEVLGESSVLSSVAFDVDFMAITNADISAPREWHPLQNTTASGADAQLYVADGTGDKAKQAAGVTGGTGFIEISGTSPYLRFMETDQGVGAKGWAFQIAGGILTIYTLNDDKTLGSPVLSIGRTGTTPKIGLFGATPVVRAGAITSPSGGATIDAEGRTAIDAMRTALANFGITL